MYNPNIPHPDSLSTLKIPLAEVVAEIAAIANNVNAAKFTLHFEEMGRDQTVSVNLQTGKITMRDILPGKWVTITNCHLEDILSNC